MTSGDFGDAVGQGFLHMTAGMVLFAMSLTLMFAIDSQQYLMGYLPVVLFTMKAMYGTLPTADVMTGPAFIMKGDASKVLELSKQGIR